MRLLCTLGSGIRRCGDEPSRLQTPQTQVDHTLLNAECVSGRILTLDAMHTQRELCAQVHRLEGDDILIAKDNQPTLREDIADLLEDRRPDRRRWQEAETWNKGHGRIEHRQIVCSPDLNEWFGNKVRHEVVYGLSSLSMHHAPPATMLTLIRDHWSIENRLYWRRDVSLGEDACQTRDFTCARSARSTY